jgi:UDP-N-acetyl-D-glucosamine dehydrogenase
VQVGVVGLGYVGLSIAIAASKAGHAVVGFDTNQETLLGLSSSRSHIEGITDADIAESLRRGARFEGSIVSLADAEVIVIAVPTPLNEDRSPDLSMLTMAATSVASIARAGTLIVNESTSYPGTLRNLIAPIVGSDKLYAAAPERIDPGNETWRIDNTPRLIGGMTPEARELAAQFYGSFCGKVNIVSSPEVAETAKLFENTFRQVNIALVNELAQICAGLDIPTNEVLDAAATKPFGFMKFLPSLGVGGHCIPVDPSYLSFIAKQAGLSTRFIDIANTVNLQMPAYVVQRLTQEFGDLASKRIQIVGISYKPDVADTRESPSLDLLHLLRATGAEVTWHDPLVASWNGEASSPLAQVDIGIIAAPHQVIDFVPWRASDVSVVDVSTVKNLGWEKYL